MFEKITTLKHLAKELNLSISTVSIALNNHPDIGETTKEKAKRLANKLDYSPNIFAKGFREHKSNTIGVLVPNISHYYTSTILKGILEEADINGYKVILSESNNDFKKQSEILKSMIQLGVDGILLSISKMTKEVNSILNTLNKIPIVLFDKVSDKIPCTQISIDEEGAAFDAVEHLISTNKKRIAIIKESNISDTSNKRFAGYLKALKKYNIPINEDFIISNDDASITQGENSTVILLNLKNRPDAIIAITDRAAIGAIKKLKKANIKIPEEIAIIGFSNSLSSTIIEPNLTTVDQPGKRIGKIAVNSLIDIIENDSGKINNKTIIINTKLIIRESSFKFK